MKEVTGYQTAILRKPPPEPLTWLYKHGLLRGRVLDYGSGRQHWYDTDYYDPHWAPKPPFGLYDTIVCNYVLNVVDEDTQEDVIRKVKALLKPGGTAYFTVRRDLPKEGKQGRGVWQRYVELNMPTLHKNATREIYAFYSGMYVPVEKPWPNYKEYELAPIGTRRKPPETMRWKRKARTSDITLGGLK